MSEHELYLWRQTFLAHLRHGEGNGIASQLADKAVCVYRTTPDRVNTLQDEYRERPGCNAAH